MRQQELEIRAREAVESLRQGHPVEASVFELKADWIDPPKAAERLAGHANAARGEPFIWLFGISETDGTVPGVQAAELADWWHQVQACFDEHVAPEMEHCLTLVDEASGNTFVAMSFVGDRAPYLVKSQKGGFPERIVPWREATGMRAASRSQLLRILLPVSTAPTFEIVASDLVCRAGSGPGRLQWTIGADVFAAPRTREEWVLPHHRCWAEIAVAGVETYYSPIRFGRFGAGTPAIGVHDSGVTISGAGFFKIEASGEPSAANDHPDVTGKPAVLRLILNSSSDVRVTAEAEVPFAPTKEGLIGRWILERALPWNRP